MEKKLDKYDYMTLEEMRTYCRAVEAHEDVMSLWEVTNGMRGYAFLRVYVWDVDAGVARKRALAAFVEAGFRQTKEHHLTMKLCLRKHSDPLVTYPDDQGFGEVYMKREERQVIGSRLWFAPNAKVQELM